MSEPDGEASSKDHAWSGVALLAVESDVNDTVNANYANITPIK